MWLIACATSSVEAPTPNSTVEEEVDALVDAHRATLGLDPLELDAELSVIAREHSQDMADGVVPFSHDGFEARAEEATEILSGVAEVAENVGMNQGFEDPAQAAMQGWLDSPSHRETIEGDYGITGIGVVEGEPWYATQLFVRVE